MDAPQEGGVDVGNRSRKFGLPGWMVNNIERLNFVTDFEQYGSSPPETEGFLAEYMENHDRTQVYESSNTSEQMDMHEKPNNIYELNKEPDKTYNLLQTASERISPHFHPLMGTIKHEELYSSPDSTPCATPEPSPVIRRKVSIPQASDTIQTNPGRWFYMGKFKKPVGNNKLLTVESNNKENKSEIQHESSGALKNQDYVLKGKKPAIQLVISNFDLNAVSPNSW